VGTVYVGNVIRLASTGARANAVASSTASRVDASTERVAASFVAGLTSAIASVDLHLNFVGNSGDVTFRVGIQADSAGAPDGTYLGSADALFAGQNNTGAVWIGLQTLMDAAGHTTPTNTGALTIGKKYWVVVDVTTAGSIGAAIYIELFRDTVFSETYFALYTGTWTKTAGAGTVIVKHADNSITGWPLTASGQLHDAALDIYVNTGVSQRQGLRFKSGAPVMIVGLDVLQNSTNTPGNLTAKLYEGATQKAASPAIPVGEIIDANWTRILFTTPVLCAADTNLYLIIEQDGTSDSNDYDVYGTTYPVAYVAAMEPGADWRFVYGTGADPTTYTVDSSGFSPRIVPLIADMAADFDQAAGGGLTLPKRYGMAGVA